MTNARVIILGILVAVLFSSCSFSEELDLSKDQQGQYKIDVDMSQAMEMMKSMGGAEQKPDSASSEPKDSVFSLYSQIDSIRDLFTDKELSYFFKGTGHLKMNEKENLLQFNLMYPVTDLQGLKDFFVTLQKKDSITKKNADTTVSVTEEPGNMDPLNQKAPPDFTNMLTPKTAYIITDSSISRESMSKEGLEKQMGDMKGMEMFFGQMTMTTTIKLPRPVIKLEGENVKLLDDKKTVVISTNLLELTSGSTSNHFYIKF